MFFRENKPELAAHSQINPPLLPRGRFCSLAHEEALRTRPGLPPPRDPHHRLPCQRRLLTLRVFLASACVLSSLSSSSSLFLVLFRGLDSTSLDST